MNIGTILHGALGDVYEQALSFKLNRDKYAGDRVIAFFSRDDRLKAFSHFNLDMFDEVLPWQEIAASNIDRFDQFQIDDEELREDVLANLPDDVLRKFDFNENKLPWRELRRVKFDGQCLRLDLSSEGQDAYEKLLSSYGLDAGQLASNCIGFLWRYRSAGGAVNHRFQSPEETIIATKSELFRELADRFKLKIIVAGMKYNTQQSGVSQIRQDSGTLAGEIAAKFAKGELAVPQSDIVYLQGLGFAAELEIISQTKFQLLMPSGFSEPVWFRNNKKAVLVDPPPFYLLKMIKYRMPLFNNLEPRGFLYNNRNLHRPKTVLRELSRRGLIES